MADEVAPGQPHVSAQQVLRAGRLDEALAELKQEVRREPADPRLRVFLFQLLCVCGEWDRALTQLNVAGELDAGTLLMVQTYREALRCEVYRAEVFAGRHTPVALGEPEPWFASLVQALKVDAGGDRDEASRLRALALENAPAASGMLNGQPFEWIADGDARLGPCLEVIINGRYFWVPLHRLRSLKMDLPADLRDFVWSPAQLLWANGSQSVAFIPTRYPGSEMAADPALRLARRTEWLEPSPGAYMGLGQRVWITNDGETALLDVRTLTVNVPGESAPPES